MGNKTYYITTPIYYPSDNLHIGHAYTTVAADTMARFKRMKGYDVWFLTGSDEHGQKIERKAKEAGKEPLEYVDKIVANFKHLWKALHISNDDFIRTTEERHKKVVQAIFKKIYDQGDIYKSEYEGWYCTPCETFWLERQLKEGNCPDCGRPVELLKEESYFFRMSKYADRLLQHIEENPDFIQPETRRNEMISFIKQGLEDLCVSRTTFKWGIPVPIDQKHVIYVWFDALTNYISALGYGEDNSKFDKYWPADLHLVGKDIVRFHTIIWPAILMAAGIELPKKVFGHGWLLLEGGKMSKSKGNVVDPLVLIEKYGVDAVRYFLLREMPYGEDGYYSEDALIERINTDLANDFGNLVSRTTAMIEKFAEGVIPSPGQEEPVDRELIELAEQTPREVERQLERFDLSNALGAIWKLVNRTNKYIDETAPWALARDPAKRSRLNTVLYNLAEALRVVTVLCTPFMPTLPDKVWQQLGLQEFKDIHTWDSTMRWGGVPGGTKIQRGPAIFPRIETKEKGGEAGEAPSGKEEKRQQEKQKEFISIEEFSRLDLRIAEVLEAENVPKTDKLLKLKVKVGEEERTVVAGIAQYYRPEELIGKKVVVVANLQPAKIRGITSEGMILAAVGDEQLGVLTVEKDLPSGAKVR
ncbi:methionine--tRNA ligase [Calderihabitans maritimus]|uniref:Methionine--tRNA ligase n=1 Tax=Calderihabitans maritimus TaxID=1246530 RepID=A0A1Z5HQ13_9FIRM|nr:methionine--tRNA ligase [Calderihabitans maritimus]GAW91622.1 methionyl-tRNA synthetase [Calderihabitans maritimus]